MNVQESLAAARYARALFQAARAAKSEEPVRRDLKTLIQRLRSDEALAELLRHPLLPVADKKRRALAELGNRVSPLFERFLDLLLRRKRLPLLPDVGRLFDEMTDEAQGLVRAQVKTAALLSEDQLKQWEARLSTLWNKKVSVEASVDPALIGGLSIRSGDKVWDMSLKAHLSRLGEKLLRTA